MSGEKNLTTLLNTLSPILNAGEFVYCSLSKGQFIDPDEVICTFKEEEGVSIIINKHSAEKLDLKYSLVLAWITLDVYSSLEAVGMTAAFSKALTDAGISCNVVAAYHHDHIFVAKQDAQKAMTVLNDLSQRNKVSPS